MRRFLGAVLAVLVPLFGLVGNTHADHGRPYGYCENGVPIIVEWPEQYNNFHAECIGDTFVTVANTPIKPPEPDEPEEMPPDFFSWAIIFLNETRMINPYDDVRAFTTATTGRTLIPIRMVTEAMGGTAEWNQEKFEVTIRLQDKYMVMRIGDAEAEANGRKIQLDQPPILWKSRTMVPVRVIMEAFGAEVGWILEDHAVEITAPGITCTPGYCYDPS